MFTLTQQRDKTEGGDSGKTKIISYRARRREISTEHSELPGNYSRQEMSVDSSGGKDMCDWMTQEGNKDNR